MLFGVVIQVKDKTKMFKRILGYLNSMLDSLKPLIEEITEYNKVLHLPKEELENFTIQMEMRVELIHKCSKGTRDVKKTLDSVAKIEDGVKRIEGSGDVQGQTDIGIGEPTLPTLEAPDAENDMTEYVPSTVTVSFDVLLRELKKKLLKDKASALVLTGPQGCGKTTLAKTNLSR
ncbi:hypothetical protein L3X38_028660 [Prunus dulcis]|uniref:RPW8 domain-containing protein n=1 Tax=Prunus dulcis TaxID=3755 RepID=A0AAD4VRK0_PRUDU|nr:hypothetical protein L3X38_028660 [Prunus dulcis]